MRILPKIFYTAKWNVGVVKMPIAEFLKGSKNIDVTWMTEPEGKSFYADPFALMNNDHIEIYFEEFVDNQKKGVISKTVFLNNSFSAAKKLFESSIHVSYPYLLNHNGKQFCIPETHQSNEIALYEIQNEQLKKLRSLVDNFAGVDATIVEWNNRMWMFCTNKLGKKADVDLYIFHADDLFGEWKSHQLNPVKSDRGSARPGGTPFINNGKLYRPSQDCGNTYGGRVVINEIIQLDENNFEEKAIAFVEPSQLNGKYNEGAHTLSSAGNYTVIDAKRYVFTLRNIFKLFRKKIS